MFGKVKEFLQKRINNRNRKKLTNTSPTLICSNCTGGFLYHWLGLRFYSPFINLYMTNDDFLTALENWEAFINTEIEEVEKSSYNYPVGRGYNGVKIHFVHYKTFTDAITKWKERCLRINPDNMAVMLTNWDGDFNIIERFDRLSFKHKVIFVDKPYTQFKSTFHLKGFSKVNGVKNIYSTQYLNILMDGGILTNLIMSFLLIN